MEWGCGVKIHSRGQLPRPAVVGLAAALQSAEEGALHARLLNLACRGEGPRIPCLPAAPCMQGKTEKRARAGAPTGFRSGSSRG